MMTQSRAFCALFVGSATSEFCAPLFVLGVAPFEQQVDGVSSLLAESNPCVTIAMVSLLPSVAAHTTPRMAGAHFGRQLPLRALPQAK